MPGTDLRILLLTARTGLVDRVRGLDLGADDQLTKPFALAEFQVGDLMLDNARDGRELSFCSD